MGADPKGVKPDFLLRMANASRRRAETARSRADWSAVSRAAERAQPVVPLQLSPEGFDLIAEVKFRAPSVGTLAGTSLSPLEQARCYAAGGAAALSVLTEPDEFAGELAHLEEVAAGLPQMPAMRKDFLVDPYQILEARASGASGVLLVVAMLDDREMRDMLHTALDLGMFALVEAFDEADLDRCLPLMDAAGGALRNGAYRLLIGVNCRDLRTLNVQFDRFMELAPRLPADIPRVAESGVQTPDQARELAAQGYQLALVGTALMRADAPADAARAILAAGRGACASS